MTVLWAITMCSVVCRDQSLEQHASSIFRDEVYRAVLYRQAALEEVMQMNVTGE
jgi:hypothetical protein